jgi:hypothetical protein
MKPAPILKVRLPNRRGSPLRQRRVPASQGKIIQEMSNAAAAPLRATASLQQETQGIKTRGHRRRLAGSAARGKRPAKPRRLSSHPSNRAVRANIFLRCARRAYSLNKANAKRAFSAKQRTAKAARLSSSARRKLRREGFARNR